MTSSTDVAVLLTSDGRELGTTIVDRLKEFPHVSSTTVDLGLSHVQTECPPELNAACQQCSVALLLATPEMLNYMQSNSGWLAQTLRDLSFSSSVVVLLLTDRRHLDDVTQKHGYVTGEWKYQVAGDTSAEVQQKIAEVLDMVDQNRQAGRARTPSSSSTTSSRKSVVGLFPSVVFEKDTSVAIVFKEDVTGEVTVKLGQMDTHLTAVRETTSVFTFTAPQRPAGKYSVTVYVDKKRQRGRPELTYRGTEVAAFTSPRYLTQALRLDRYEDLDLYLKDLFNHSLPADHGLDVLFRHLPQADSSERQKNADSHYPTLLHFAAAFGLSEFTAALLDCPGSARAFCIRNCDGLDPAKLAAENEFDELEDYILDFMELQSAATQSHDDDHNSHYMKMTGLPTGRGSRAGSLYSTPSVETSSLPGTGPPLPGSFLSQSLQAPTLPPRPGGTLPLHTSLPSRPPDRCYWTLGSGSPSLPPGGSVTSISPSGSVTSASAPGSVTPTSSPASSPSSERPTSSLYWTIWSAEQVKGSSAVPPSVSVPPVPPPRARSSRIVSVPVSVPKSVKVEEQEDHVMASSLSEVKGHDPLTFMGMDNGPSTSRPELPAGALGSRSQGELIEVQELVKSQEISQKEAQMLFRGWQQRYGRNSAASFKDRQKGLQNIKYELKKHKQEQVKRNQTSGSGPKQLLARFLFGGRHRKDPPYTINISEPVSTPSNKKPPKVYSRANSDSQLVVPKHTLKACSCATADPRDSGYSQQSYDSGVSTIGGLDDLKIEEDDVFSSEEGCRRSHQTDASAKKRVSRGNLYLQQIRDQTQRDGKNPPPLPSIYFPSAEETDSDCGGSDRGATHL